MASYTWRALSSRPSWEATADPLLRAACAAAVVALVPVPAAALRWSPGHAFAEIKGDLAAIQVAPLAGDGDGARDGDVDGGGNASVAIGQWVPVAARAVEDPLAEGGGDPAAATLWYCRRCRSRLFVTGVGLGRGGEENAAGGGGADGELVRLFAGALSDAAAAGGAAGYGGGGRPDRAAWAGDIEWRDAPAILGGGCGCEAHWFPTAEDGATPAAPAPVQAVASDTRNTPTSAAKAGAAGTSKVSFACACGGVRAVSAVGVTQVQHCHCRMCRQLHGAPFATWAGAYTRPLFGST
jgi:hypothetical protein